MLAHAQSALVCMSADLPGRLPVCRRACVPACIHVPVLVSAADCLCGVRFFCVIPFITKVLLECFVLHSCVAKCFVLIY